MMSQSPTMPALMENKTLKPFTQTQEAECLTAAPQSKEEAATFISASKQKKLTVCVRGSGYSYGDMILNKDNLVVFTKNLNRILNYDKEKVQ